MVKKTYVEVRCQWEGLHRWEQAPDAVEFLRRDHRHIFHIRVRMEVTHDDREVEFILLKRMLMNLPITKKYTLGKMSCEVIADYYVECLQKSYGTKRAMEVEVSEDGENGAVVKIE